MMRSSQPAGSLPPEPPEPPEPAKPPELPGPLLTPASQQLTSPRCWLHLELSPIFYAVL